MNRFAEGNYKAVHNIQGMEIKKILNEILNYSGVAAVGYTNLYIGATVALLIVAVKLFYGYKQRSNPIEDKQEYYENGSLKSSTKKYRQ